MTTWIFSFPRFWLTGFVFQDNQYRQSFSRFGHGVKARTDRRLWGENARTSGSQGSALGYFDLKTELLGKSTKTQLDSVTSISRTPANSGDSSVRLSLTCTHHLACISGAETGRVLGLPGGTPLRLGAGTILFRPATGLMARFCLGTLLVSGDISLLWCGFPRKKIVLHLGTKIRLDQNLWQARARPSRAQWSIPGFDQQGQPKSFNRKWLFFLPIIFLGFTLFRWISFSAPVLFGISWVLLIGILPSAFTFLNA